MSLSLAKASTGDCLSGLGSLSLLCPAMSLLTKSVSSSLIKTNTVKSSIHAVKGDGNNEQSNGFIDNMVVKRMYNNVTPRVKSTFFMAAALSLHYGGYEFLRNSVLALFTSSATGFQSPAAYPLANGLVSPFSVFLLYLYGRQLEQYGPRIALRTTTLWSVMFIMLTGVLLKASQLGIVPLPKQACQMLISLSFLFQNSYNYLIATQQWSFINSVLTPDEGSKWFTVFTGTSSLFCTITGSLVPFLLPWSGLLGLFTLTAVPLTAALMCQDRAYLIAQRNGFDPSAHAKLNARKTANIDTMSEDSQPKESKSLRMKTMTLFRREPTLGALFAEVVSFQSLNTILTVALVEALKESIPNDVARSSYTSQFYAAINGSSAVLQFLVDRKSVV